LAELTRPLKEFLREKELIKALTVLAVKTEEILAKLKEQNIYSFTEVIEKLLDVLKDHHLSHRHNNGKFARSRINPKMEFVMAELYSRQNLTSNKSIHGKDYFFEQNDKKGPLANKVINPSLKITHEGVPRTAWANYKSYVLSSILGCSGSFSFSGNYADTADKVIKDIIKNIVVRDSDIGNISKNFILEMNFKIDVDDNGMIYGEDFIIPEVNQSNEFLQKIISSIPEDISKNIPIISLNTYLKDVNILSGDTIMIDIPHILEPELVTILIQEFQTGTDIDGDGYVFGKDIIILDPPEILKPYNPQYLPSTIITWNAFKQYYKIFLESSNSTRQSSYYVQKLIDEYTTKIDQDYNDLIYNVDFIIKDDIYKPEELKIIEQNISLTQISFKEYAEALPFDILKGSNDSGIACVRLAHEFTYREQLIDVDYNGMINGIDFIINDYDLDKYDSLIQLERNTLFSIHRRNLNYIKCKYFKSSSIEYSYTQQEFNAYWENISGIQEQILDDNIEQDDFGRTVINSQITNISYPTWTNKTSSLPLFIPILSLYDFINMTNSTSVQKYTLTVNKTGGGYIDSIPKVIGCGIDCVKEFVVGSRINLIPYPDFGYQFKTWEGDFTNCDVSIDPTIELCQLIMFENKSITCVFELKEYTIKLYKVSGDGKITDSLGNVLCDSNVGISVACEFKVTHGSTINIIASPSVGYEFDSWEGVDESNGVNAKCVIYGEREIIANFIKTYQLSINVLTDPDIEIDVYYLRIKQLSSRLYTFRENSEIVIYATPSLPYKLDGFDGTDSSFGNRCTVNMSANRIVTINLSFKEFYLTILKPGGTGVVTDSTGIINCGTICKNLFRYGTIINLMAIPDEGFEFVEWSGSDNDGQYPICTVTMHGNKTISAEFKHIVKTLKIQITGTGSGSIKNSLLNIDCDNYCQYIFNYDTTITLRAIPDTGCEVKSWTNVDHSEGDDANLVLIQDRLVTVEIELVKFFLRISFNNGLGIVRDDSLNIKCPRYTVNDQDFDFFSSNISAVEWYDFVDARSENQTHQYDKTCVIIPYLNSEDNSISLILRVGAITSSNSPNTLYGTITQLPPNHIVLISDDAGEAYSNSTTSVTYGFNYNPNMTDGVVIGNINDFSSIIITNTSWTNLDKIRVIHKTGYFEYPINTVINISCNKTCSYELDFDQAVNLTLDPVFSGYNFTSWNGVDSTFNLTSSLVMGSDRLVLLNFSKSKKTLTIQKVLQNSSSGNIINSTLGINCGETCSYTIDYGNLIQLTAIPSENSSLISWSGVDISSSDSCSLVMTSDRTIIATFDIKTISLTIQIFGSGSILDSTNSITCSSTCSKTLNYGTVVTLTATPSVGCIFSGWSGSIGGDTINSNQISFTIETSRTITVTFEVQYLSLSVSKTGNGTIADSSLSINCGTICSKNIAYGTSVNLLATPDSGYEFFDWANCPSPSGNSCSFSITSNTSVTSNFAHLLNGLIFKTTAETNEFLSNYAQITPETIYNRWNVFGQDNYYEYPTRPTLPPESSWFYRSDLKSVYQPDNSGYSNGFISSEKLYRYQLEATLRSDSTDDDGNGIVVAFVRDTVNSQNHFLTAFIANGGIGGSSYFTLVYDFPTARMKTYASRTYDRVYDNPSGNSGWQQSGPVRLKIVRENDIITCYATKWNDLNNYQPDPIVIDLNSDSFLNVFKGAQSYGFMSISQPGSFYQDIVMVGGTDYNYIYDNQAHIAYTYDTTVNLWKTTAVTPQQYFGVISKVTNPFKSYSFILKASQIIEI